jgi:cytochrome c oxidase subunit 4
MAEPHTPRVKLVTYVGTYAALAVLATLSLMLKGLPETVAVTLSLIIASVKAVAVLLFFMHLIEERFSFRFVMWVSGLLVVVLIVLTTLDPLTRAPFPPGPSHNPSYAQDKTPPPGTLP